MQIKFTKSGANSQFGSFSAGDVMRCSNELAKHLIEMGVAENVESAVKRDSPTEDSETKKPVRRGK